MLVFSLHRGESFYVSDLRVELVDFDAAGAVVRVKRKQFRVPNHLVDLPGADGVRVSAGQRGEAAIRIGIEAPLEVKVLRERLYLRSQEGKVPRRRGPRRVHLAAADCTICRGTMLIKQTDEEDRTVELPCPKAQNPALPICSDQR